MQFSTYSITLSWKRIFSCTLKEGTVQKKGSHAIKFNFEKSYTVPISDVTFVQYSVVQYVMTKLKPCHENSFVHYTVQVGGVMSSHSYSKS